MAVVGAFSAALLLFVPRVSVAAGCPTQVAADALNASIDRALQKIADFDIDAFRTETDAVRGMMPCVSEPLSPKDAASLHRLFGLRAFGERNVESSVAFAAARFLDPDFVFPEDVVPTGNPVLDDYNVIDLAARQTDEVPEPTVGQLSFDGQVSLERPLNWPTIVQIYDGESAIADSVYLLPGDRMPFYPGSGTIDTERLRAPLLVFTGATAVGAGVLYAVALANKAAYRNPDNLDYRQLDTQRASTNALVISAGVSGIVSVASGVTVGLLW